MCINVYSHHHPIPRTIIFFAIYIMIYNRGRKALSFMSNTLRLFLCYILLRFVWFMMKEFLLISVWFLMCWIKRWRDQKSWCKMGSTPQFWDSFVFHVNFLKFGSNRLLPPLFSLVSAVSVDSFNKCVKSFADSDWCAKLSLTAVWFKMIRLCWWYVL